MDNTDKLKELKTENKLEILNIKYVSEMIKNIIREDQSSTKNVQLYEIVYNNIKNK